MLDNTDIEGVQPLISWTNWRRRKKADTTENLLNVGRKATRLRIQGEKHAAISV